MSTDDNRRRVTANQPAAGAAASPDTFQHSSDGRQPGAPAARTAAPDDSRVAVGGHEQKGLITDSIRALIETQRLCYVATAGLDGQPNLSPKGSLKVLSPHHLAFADMASPQTVANLRLNPRLEINVVDPFLRRGYRIKGTAEVLDDPVLLAAVGEGLGHEFPIRAAVRITVTETRPVDSPVYLFTDTPPEQVQTMWEEIYGYRPLEVSPRPDPPTPHTSAGT